MSCCSRKATLNAQDEPHRNGLLAASKNDLEDIFEALFGVDSDIDAQDGHFVSALEAASAHGHEDIAELPVEGNGHTDTEDEDHMTPPPVPAIHDPRWKEQHGYRSAITPVRY